jgi:hypothetical protein
MTYQKMDPEAKKAWLEALRSGRYKQGQGKLRREGDEFCCLGVLCDLGQDRDKKWRKVGLCYAYGSLDDTTIPPDEVRDKSGLNPETVGALWRMNDGVTSTGKIQGKPFSEIADWIEANL